MFIYLFIYLFIFIYFSLFIYLFFFFDINFATNKKPQVVRGFNIPLSSMFSSAKVKLLGYANMTVHGVVSYTWG